MSYRLSDGYGMYDFLLMCSYYYTNNIELAAEYHQILSDKCDKDSIYYNYWVRIFDELLQNKDENILNNLIECFEYSRENERASEQIYVLDAIIDYCKDHDMHEERAQYLEIMISYFRK